MRKLGWSELSFLKQAVQALSNSFILLFLSKEKQGNQKKGPTLNTIGKSKEKTMWHKTMMEKAP